MDKIRIIGGTPLYGSIRISGAKNAALPLMCASLLTKGTLSLSNIPYLADIVTMARLLMQHGVHISMNDVNERQQQFSGMTLGRTLDMNAGNITNRTAPYEIVRKMRASVLVLGPLLARFGEAHVSLPGGCAIGTRPIDLHLKALEQMGADITLDHGYVTATAPDGLKGADIYFDKVSVGATENVLMAATLAHGTTTLHNAAQEPEISDLAHCLVAMGAEIDGIGTANLTIRGKSELHGAQYSVIPDRIEAGTYLAAAAVTGGELRLQEAPLQALRPVLDKMRDCGLAVSERLPDADSAAGGVSVSEQTGELFVQANGKLKPVDIITQPHPGFPTDMQAQFMAMMALAEGSTTITETIFENRFMHVPELVRMGADITIAGRTATIKGVSALHGADVMATDLRASVSLVIAALSTPEETTLHRIYHLDRGYENLESKLARCQANIQRVG